MKIIRIITVIMLFSFAAFFTSSAADNYEFEKIVVLYTEKDPIYPALPPDCCKYQKMEEFVNNGTKANTVILAGHGEPPLFAGYMADKVAEMISSYSPEMIIINSCYGASTSLMDELVKTSPGKFVVASPFQIYIPGYVFGKDFFNFDLSSVERAIAVTIEPDYPILKWVINEKDIKAAKEAVFSMEKQELQKRLRRRTPPLVRVPAPGNIDRDGEILVHLSIEEITGLLK